MRTCYKSDKHDHTFHSSVYEQSKPGPVWTSTTSQQKKYVHLLCLLGKSNLAGAKKSINAKQMCLYRNAFVLLFVYSAGTSK